MISLFLGNSLSRSSAALNFRKACNFQCNLIVLLEFSTIKKPDLYSKNSKVLSGVLYNAQHALLIMD